MARVVEIIHKDARHEWYNRTVELSELYRKLVTGDGLDSLLKPFVRREDDASFQQRVALTQHVVTTVTENIMDVFNKVPRANYQRILTHDGKTDNPKTVALEEVVSGFWGQKPLDAYMKTRWLEMNATDPNGFVVVEFKPFDHNRERARPYPFEVSARQAVDYAYQNNVLQHLVVETDVKFDTAQKKGEDGKKYTVYLQNETFTVTQVDPRINTAVKDGEFVVSETDGFLKSKNRLFFIEFALPHGAGEVPAMQVGYNRDAWTSGQTHVAPYEAAVPLLKKSIKVNSELDITMSQQVFPHRLQYMPKCGGHEGKSCHDGYGPNGEICGACKGTGHSSITSAQEVIYFSMPKRGEDMIDLEKILVFKGPPIDVVKFQSEYVDKLTAGCKAVVFNSESFTQAQIQGTATGQMLDRDNVQDTLFTCAQGYAEMWQFLVRITAKFTDLFKTLDARIIFSKDFKLKGLSELIADLETAKRSGSGPAVIRHIQEQISRLIYSDAPDLYNKWAVQERFNPFSGFSEEQMAMALASPSVPARIKTRFYMFGMVFSELEAENPNFYNLPEARQRELIEAKVKTYMDEAGANEPPVIAIPGNGVAQPANN